MLVSANDGARLSVFRAPFPRRASFAIDATPGPPIAASAPRRGKLRNLLQDQPGFPARRRARQRNRARLRPSKCSARPCRGRKLRLRQRRSRYTAITAHQPAAATRADHARPAQLAPHRRTSGSSSPPPLRATPGNSLPSQPTGVPTTRAPRFIASEPQIPSAGRRQFVFAAARSRRFLRRQAVMLPSRLRSALVALGRARHRRLARCSRRRAPDHPSFRTPTVTAPGLAGTGRPVRPASVAESNEPPSPGLHPCTPPCRRRGRTPRPCPEFPAPPRSQEASLDLTRARLPDRADRAHHGGNASEVPIRSAQNSVPGHAVLDGTLPESWPVCAS